VPDRPERGLNAALAHAATAARERWPGCGVAAMSADLAALRPAELRDALLAAPPRGRGVVADATGSGTVLLTAAPVAPLRPQFGPRSHAAHVGAGAVDLTVTLGSAVSGLRQDVDTLRDLTAARRLGVGPATAGVLSRRGRNADDGGGITARPRRHHTTEALAGPGDGEVGERAGTGEEEPLA
jgi:2-phospho-L-lactate guanylyltransferase